MTIYKQITLNVIVVYCKLGFFKNQWCKSPVCIMYDKFDVM